MGAGSVGPPTPAYPGWAVNEQQQQQQLEMPQLVGSSPFLLPFVGNGWSAIITLLYKPVNLRICKATNLATALVATFESYV